MYTFDIASRFRKSAGFLLAGNLLVALLLTGCARTEKPVEKPAKYVSLGKKTVPAVLKDTILERTEIEPSTRGPLVVSGYGLVVNLRNTGDSTAPASVRDYIIKEMVKRGFGSKLIPDYAGMQPEAILRDPRVAIVRVDGFIPPGARKGQFFDVGVSALPSSTTSSLANGELYRTDLRLRGASLSDPGGSVNVIARAQGPLFVNPAYALETPDYNSPANRATLRNGLAMDGGVVTEDRAVVLRLREPSLSACRYMEKVINQRFQSQAVAAAKDEGLLYCFVPMEFNGDWERFIGIVQHLYLNPTPEFAVVKSRQLAEEAVKDGAPLADITLAWEGLGKHALPQIVPLMAHPKMDVAYAAARAAAFLGDSSAVIALAQMAGNKENPFQLNAIDALGKLPPSPLISQKLRELLSGDQTLARIEAYLILTRQKDT